MQHARTLVASIIATLLAAAALPVAAEPAALRGKGPIVDADGIASARAWPPGLARRGAPIDRDCATRERGDALRGIGRGDALVPLSSYEDDPFAADSIVECLPSSYLGADGDGLRLSNGWVGIEEESRIYRRDPSTGLFRAFATNPWPQPLSNAQRNFAFPDEPRFPLHAIERDASGLPVLRDGLQVWKPRQLQRGMNVAFEAAHAARHAVERWSGRSVSWASTTG